MGFDEQPDSYEVNFIAVPLHLKPRYRSLQDTLVVFFAWHPRVWLVLDWYHVVKKFKEDLSRACRAREVRNRRAIALKLCSFDAETNTFVHFLNKSMF